MNWEEEILRDLNEPQAEAVRHTEGPLLILAGAGSGKTRTIIHRLAWLIHVKKVQPWRIVCVTFTNKAAKEMSDRALSVAGPISAETQIRTYHSLGLWLLRLNSKAIQYPSNFTIWDDTDQIGAIQMILPQLSPANFNKTEIRYLSNTISSFKDRVITPEELSEKIDLDELEHGDILQELYALYELRKNASFAMDFADLLYRSVRLLQTNPEIAEETRRKYRYFMVDEYQDTNFAQYSLVQLLTQETRNLCVVGDDDQAIYGWRGADVSNILDFSRDFPEAKIVKLEENYRSTQIILDIANQVISHNTTRMEKHLFTNRIDQVKPRLLVTSDEQREAIAIAEIILSLRGSVPLHEIAVLYRTNAQSRLIEEALLTRKVFYRVFGGVSFFSRKEIKDTLSYLRFIVNPHDEVSFLRLLNTPSRGIGEKTIEKIYEYRNTSGLTLDFLTLLAKESIPGISGKAANSIFHLGKWLAEYHARAQKKVDLGFLLEEILDLSGLRESFEEEDRLLGTSRMENLFELKNSLMDFQAKHTNALLSQYLQDISLFTGTEGATRDEDKEAVNLMTVHNAKGLEFSTVFIAGLDDEVFPHYLALREDNLEEERRLFYVAVTRAKNRLYLSRAGRRIRQGFYENTRPSIFISEIPDNLIDLVKEAPLGYSPIQSSFRKPEKTGKKTHFPGTIHPEFIKQASGPDAKINQGDSVIHQNFGKGRVLRIEGSGDSAKIHIFFDDGKTRKFLMRYTPLEKL